MVSNEDYSAQELRALKAQHAEELKLGAEIWRPETEMALLDRLKRKTKLAVKKGRPKLEKAVIGGYPFVSSGADLKQLQQMDLSDMYLRGTHRGGFLLCRVLTRPVNLSIAFSSLNPTLNLPVASPDGSAALLRLHNYPLLPSSLGQPTASDIDAVFPFGTLLAILEPTVRRDLADGEWVVWVDAASDVVVLKEGESALEDIDWTGAEGKGWKPGEESRQSLDEWKDEGNKAFSACRYLLAESLYTKGVSQHSTSPDLSLLLLNRAATYLRLERFSSALSDANRVISLLSPTDPLLEKAYLRKGKALYSLRRWTLSLAAFTHLLAISPALLDALSGISACKARIKEAETGEYHIPSLYAQALAAKEGGIASMDDVADFIGPIKVVSIADKGGGRGLVATRNIQPGEVLLAVRAVALVSATNLPTSQTKLLVYNLEEMVVDTSNSLYYVHSVLYRLRDQPELASKVYDLYLGPRGGEETPATFDLHAPKEETLTGGGNVRIDRAEDIGRAIYYNASVPFRIVPVPAGGGDSIAYGGEDSPAALFSESAMANHSCSWNAFHSFFASFQLTRSTTFIPLGTEILASYTPDLPHAFRTPRLAKFFPDPCACPLCTSDLLSPTLNARPGLIVRLRREQSALPASLAELGQGELEKRRAKLQQLVDELRATYAVPGETAEEARKRDQPDLFFGHEALRGVLRELARRSGTWREVVDNEVAGLEALGAVVRRQPSGTEREEGFDALLSLPRYRHAEATLSLVLIAGYLHSAGEALEGEFGLVEVWLSAAARVEGCTVGGDREFFEARWREVLREKGVEGYLATSSSEP